MTGNKNAWRAPLAGLASVAMIATMGVTALSANAVTYPGNNVNGNPEFTVKFDAGSRGTAEDTELSSTHNNGYKLSPTAPIVKAGWTFTGWYTKDGVAVDWSKPVTKDMTVFAHYGNTENGLVTVTYDTNNLPDYSVDNGATKESYTIAQGDKLADWQKPFDNVADGQILTWGSEIDGPINRSITVKPDVEDGAKVTFETGGYLFANGETSYTTEVAEGSTIATEPVAANVNPADQSLSADHAYKAVKAWKNAADDTYFKAGVTKFDAHDYKFVSEGDTTAYKVLFAVNRGWSADQWTAPENYAFGQPESVVIKAGQSVDVKAAAAQLNLYDGLYEVANYAYDQNGKEKAYNGEAVEKIVADGRFDTTIRINLKRAAAATYTVTLDPNWGTADPTTVTVTAGGKLALPATPVRDGYKFMGWSTSVSGTAVEFPYTVSSDVTLYAQWTLAAYADLEDLLNIPSSIYTQTSYAAYKQAVESVAKDANSKAKDAIKLSGARYVVDEDLVSEAQAAEYVKTLEAAKSKLEYLPELRNTYTDVNVLTPHVEDIWYLTALGVAKGYDDGTFRPSDGLNRQDFAAFLYRAAIANGEKEYAVDAKDNIFADVNENTPHYKEILWAASKGIIKGYDENGKTLFKGMDTLNRQDAAAFVYRLADHFGEVKTDGTTKPAGAFADEAQTSHLTEVKWAAANGIAKGYADGTFKGMNTLNRQDASAFLGRLLRNVLGM